MDIEKRQLTTIKDTSVFLLSKPSDFARHFLYYMIGLGHFYATEYYTETRPSNAYDSFLLMYILNGKLYAEEGGSGCEASAGEYRSDRLLQPSPLSRDCSYGVRIYTL